jgi:phosphatidate phosphatase APP1
MEDGSDRILVGRCLRGDREAYAELVRQHAGRVYAVCMWPLLRRLRRSAGNRARTLRYFAGVLRCLSKNSRTAASAPGSSKPPCPPPFTV